jgi:hypothetical protein
MSEAATFRDMAQKISVRRRRSPDVREIGTRVWNALAGTPQRRERTRKRLLIGGPPLLAFLALGGWLIFRPTPQPDYETARIDKLFNYTLLTDEFNNLSIEKRMELIGQLVQRLQNMSAGDSAMLGAFAAGIAGAARQQIEENVSKLAIDLWDKHAREYNTVAPEQRSAFLDSVFIDFVRTMETVSGQTSRQTDEEMIADVRRQSQRDMQRMREGRGVPPPEALGRTFSYLRYNVGSHASPAQKTRGQLLIRDMVRHFREDGGGG